MWPHISMWSLPWPFKKSEPVKVWTQKELEHMSKCHRMLRYISGTHMLPEARAARKAARLKQKAKALKRLQGCPPPQRTHLHKGLVDDAIYSPEIYHDKSTALEASN